YRSSSIGRIVHKLSQYDSGYGLDAGSRDGAASGSRRKAAGASLAFGPFKRFPVHPRQVPTLFRPEGQGAKCHFARVSCLADSTPTSASLCSSTAPICTPPPGL